MKKIVVFKQLASRRLRKSELVRIVSMKIKLANGNIHCIGLAPDKDDRPMLKRLR